MQKELTNINTLETKKEPAFPLNNEDYSKILDQLGLTYKRIDVHLQVGEITQTQGWILHISVIVSQITEQLKSILPTLISEKIPFKIIQDKETAKNLLNGNLGIELIGKVISLYPSSPEKALSIAKLSIKLTQRFRGPAILTDAHLGGNVYTRYGSFNPIVISNRTGNPERCIYNPEGQMVTDEYRIPFILAKGQLWPFEELSSPWPKPTKKTFPGKYKPISLLKPDPRGSVFKALYLKNIFNIKWCVIKEGKKDMWSDDAGRDIPERLLWQYELHKHLEGFIPTPRAFDLFSEENDRYLVTEYIKGKSLINYIYSLNKSTVPWNQLSYNKQCRVIDFILQITNILDKLHTLGYVHRDITPVNFLVTRSLQLYIIDNELAYSLNDNKPSPPFGVGTAGFMSPEQMSQEVPTISEDIYGLGASMIVLLTGLSPLTIETKNAERLFINLNFLLGHSHLAETISHCLNPNPTKRPSLHAIRKSIEKYQGELQRLRISDMKIENDTIDSNNLKALIESAIKGLVLPPTIIENDLWYSTISTKGNRCEKQQFGFTLKAGLGVGILGVLYLLSKAKRFGYNIEPCMKAYSKGWKYIEDSFLSTFPNIAPGLYGGAAGLALTMAAGIRSAIISNDDQNLHLIQRCLELPPVSLDLAAGLAGQGVALMQCSEYLEHNFVQKILAGYIHTLQSTQKKDGRWITTLSNQAKQGINIGTSKSNIGIIIFLLKYLSSTADENVKKMVSKGIYIVETYTNKLLQLFHQEGYQSLSINRPTVLEEIHGQLLMYMKAYEVLEEEKYKTMAEKIFNNLPSKLLSDNFSQDSGLAGLGEIYLEGFRIFDNLEWLERATWIAKLFIHTCHYNTDHLYWVGNNFKFSTADFLTGNSGIIHFLIRYLTPNSSEYRILQ